VLEDLATGRGDEAVPAAAPPHLPRRPLAARLAPWAVVALALALAAWGLGRAARPRPAANVRFTIQPPADTTVVADQYPSVDVSRDGRRIAFVAADTDGVRRLFLRELGQIEPRELPGTEEARAPFFAPDGRSIGFFSFSELKRVSTDGGAPIVLARMQNARGGAWVDEATIVFPIARDGWSQRDPEAFKQGIGGYPRGFLMGRPSARAGSTAGRPRPS
jgi:serine/threonine-protein kinase